MEVKYKYVWDAAGSKSNSNNPDSEGVATTHIKSDISHMVTKGCYTKELKSKMKKLNSLNAAML